MRNRSPWKCSFCLLFLSTWSLSGCQLHAFRFQSHSLLFPRPSIIPAWRSKVLMVVNSSPETIMSTVPSPETISISPFTLPRPAPPPIIVPLFSTDVRSRRATVSAIHEDLFPKPRLYHPYPQTKRSVSSNAPAPASASKTSSSPDLMSGSTSLEPQPGSPLTPITEELPADSGHTQINTQTEPRVILAPPPSGTRLFSKLELAEAVARDYRVKLFLPHVYMPCLLPFSLLQKGRFKT